MSGAPSGSRRPARRRVGAAPAPPPPRRFAQARARTSYERLLRAAAELYAEQGYPATQTPDIAERAGMSVGALYRYFRDRHQIFLELVHHGLEARRIRQERLRAALEEPFAKGRGDLRAFAKGLVDGSWEAARRTPPELLRTVQAMSFQDPATAALRDQYERYEREATARLLARVAPRRRLPSPRAAATALDLAVEALAAWAALHPGAESRGLRRATADLVYRYLASP